MIGNDLFPDCGDVAMVGMQSCEKGKGRTGRGSFQGKQKATFAPLAQDVFSGCQIQRLAGCRAEGIRTREVLISPLDHLHGISVVTAFNSTSQR